MSLDFTLKTNLPEEERPCSAGFYYDLDCGDISKFINLLVNEKTANEVIKAMNIIYDFANAIEKCEEVDWM